MVTETDAHRRKQVLIILRGLPASGKSTVARKWVAADPSERMRINRDELRSMTFHSQGRLTHEQELVITCIEQDSVRVGLLLGYSVVDDAMNHELQHVNQLVSIADSLAVPYEVCELDTGIEECIRRDRERGAQMVGEDVIRMLHHGRKKQPNVATTKSGNTGVGSEGNRFGVECV